MLKLHLPDMSCNHCRQYVQVAVQDIDQSAILEFDMEDRSVTVNTQASEVDVISALASAGYVATKANGTFT